MSKAPPGGVSRTRIAVTLALAGAVVFGLCLGYLAYVNDSFPAKQEPFGDYAHVVFLTFNGTEFAISIQWDNASALPLYTQLNSPSTDAANTPVCGVGLSNVTAGQVIFMPFAISPTSATLENVDLSIAVRALATGSEFTIVYNVASISATNTPISPSNISCRQPPGVE